MRNVVAYLLLVAGLLVGRAVDLDAQSLVAVAQQTAEARERAKQAPPSKVYTNKDLVAVPATPSTTIAPAHVPAAPVPPIAARPASSAAARDEEAYWRGRLASLVVQRETDIHALALIHARIDRLEDRYDATIGSNRLANGGVSLGGVIAATPEAVEIARLGTERDALNAKIADDDRAIADLKEEGRQAGARPGWFR